MSYIRNQNNYFGPRRGPLLPPPVFDFLLAGSFFEVSNLRLLLLFVDDVDGSTLKKVSSRPCVDVLLFFWIFL